MQAVCAHMSVTSCRDGRFGTRATHERGERSGLNFGELRLSPQAMCCENIRSQNGNTESCCGTAHISTSLAVPG